MKGKLFKLVIRILEWGGFLDRPNEDTQLFCPPTGLFHCSILYYQCIQSILAFDLLHVNKKLNCNYKTVAILVLACSTNHKYI